MATNTHIQRDETVFFPLGLNSKDILGKGITALVGHLDAVVKFAPASKKEDIDREEEVYKRLDCGHGGILRYYDRVGDALILQHAIHGSIREYLKIKGAACPLSIRMRWAEQVVSAVAFLHSRDVLHGDISCNNVFLDENLNAKIGDFAGSSIDGKAPLVCYEVSHDHPDNHNISWRTELFALGSTLYEIMTGCSPYSGLPDAEIEYAYKRGAFPSTKAVLIHGDIITRCWQNAYESVQDLLADIEVNNATYSQDAVTSNPAIPPFITIAIASIVSVLIIRSFPR